MEEVGIGQILDQLEHWYHVTQDPRMDGFAGKGARDKIARVHSRAQELLEKTPRYVGDPEPTIKEKRCQ